LILIKYFSTRKKWIYSIHFFLFTIGGLCSAYAQTPSIQAIDSAKWILSQCIKAHGGAIDSSTLNLTFRNKLYKGVFEGGNFEMSRLFKKGDSLYLDKLNNTEFVRTINNQKVELSERRINGYSNSLNSVFYFAMLPFKLSDKAVILSYLRKQKTKNGEYFLVKVSFKQEGGGEDHQDQFRYWINTKTFQLDYFAYSYQTSGGGVRFRAVNKRHKIDSGYIFQDYVNYKANLGVDLDKLLQMQENGELKEVSRIELENVGLKNL
tara:strand:+ start:643 stop:1434 length:792 start_codon:yes stop_codon:yes gene_type:complete